MLNDASSALSLLNSRRSAKPRDMSGPGPSEADLEEILAIAARVPDHGQLTPWRLVIVADEQRDTLAALLRGALSAEQPGATDAHYCKEQDFAHYAGTLVVLIAAPVPDHKVPVWEQELSCGAVGMNLLNGAAALGYVAGWVTGWRAYSPTVTASFCRPGERLAGFIFIGHSDLPPEERPRPGLDSVVSRWQASEA
jgi:nitroreductase